MKILLFRKTFFAIAMLLSISLGACTTTQSSQFIPEADVTDITALKKRGNSALKAEKYDVALKTYQTAIHLDDKDSEARFGLAESFLKLGVTDKALENYNILIPDAEYQFQAHQGIGLASLKRGDQLKAEESLVFAVEGDNSLWRAWNGLAQVYDYQKMWDESDFAYSNALEHTPDEHVIYNNMGVSYMAQERFKDAEKAFIEAMRYKTNLKISEINYKLALAMQNKYDEATIESDELDRSESLNNAGYAAMLQGNYAQAERLLLKAIEVRPSFYKAAYNNLQVLHQLKKNK
ncbi:MAG: tetratricopeptide repeat protein [Alphaproteobacteria bacterium]|nr:tetratricopeptide repeat protein [Alphaproteobacteria bacterium]